MEVIPEQKEHEETTIFGYSKGMSNESATEFSKEFTLIFSLDFPVHEMSKSEHKKSNSRKITDFLCSVTTKFNVILLSEQHFADLWDNDLLVGSINNQNFKFVNIDENSDDLINIFPLFDASKAVGILADHFRPYIEKNVGCILEINNQLLQDQFGFLKTLSRIILSTKLDTIQDFQVFLEKVSCISVFSR